MLKSHRRNKLLYEVKRYFGEIDVVFREVTAGRTNTNFFVEAGRDTYFLRSNITKVVDSEFGGKLEKESKIYQQLQGKGITSEFVHFYDEGDLQFLLLEKLSGIPPQQFFQHQQLIKDLLISFQSIDYKELSFLHKFDLFVDFKNLLEERIAHVTSVSLQEILSSLTSYLYDRNWNFEQEFCLCHNDFRSDNLLVDEKAYMIDLESLVVSDRYVDVAEYYVGGIFWDNFTDEKTYNYTHFVQHMNFFGCDDPAKQQYVFIVKFCSNFAWLSSHLSQEENPLDLYKNTLERNVSLYNQCIQPLLHIK